MERGNAMKSLIGLLVFGLVLGIGIGNCFSAETLVKVDDYSAIITISEVITDGEVETSIARKKIYTLKELNQLKLSAIEVLKSWEAEEVRVKDNIAEQSAKIDMWNRLIKKMKDLNVVAME